MIDLEKKANELRKKIIEVCYKTQSGHPSSALSCVEIMTALYYGDILKFNAESVWNDNRNRFILSKGHACILQYIVLADLGILNPRLLMTFCKKESILGGHANCLLVPGVEFSAGSLGHGLSYALGQALNLKYLNKQNQVYVLLGDGECQEGSVWEAALCAANHKLNNLTVIIDANKLQSSGFVKDISNLEPMEDKWRSFGYRVFRVNGHNIGDLLKAFHAEAEGKPKVIIADTLKGKGISLMENKNYWHAKRPNAEQWEQIKKELEINE